MLLAAVFVLIVLAMVAGVYFHFNPVLLIFAALGIGIYGVSRIGGPAPPGGGFLWGSGQGIYLRGDDIWVAGRESDATFDVNDGAPREKPEGDPGKQ